MSPLPRFALTLAIAAVVAAASYARFRFAHPMDRARKSAAEAADEVVPTTPLIAPRVAAEAVRGLSLLPRLTWMYLRETVRNVYFGVFALAGVLFRLDVVAPVDLYERHTGLDEPAAQQARLAEAR